ncbi:MAG TPA: hypothetical protein VFO80_12620 [Sphingomonas sp.]|nr:hypothetical protein [Sphingomonas sp.]
MSIAPVAAQEVATPSAQEPPAGQGQSTDAATPVTDAQAPLQTRQLAEPPPPRARMSVAEKAAAITGAVAAGVVAFKGLSALFKSKKQAEPAPPAN